MDNRIISIAVLVLVMFSHPGSSQVTRPEMTFHSLAGLAARNADDGRVSRRIGGDTVGLVRVEWPAGTRTTPHNHANELIVLLLEGRLRAISGGAGVHARARATSSSCPPMSNTATRCSRTRSPSRPWAPARSARRPHASSERGRMSHHDGCTVARSRVSAARSGACPGVRRDPHRGAPSQVPPGPCFRPPVRVAGVVQQQRIELGGAPGRTDAALGGRSGD